MKTVIIIGRGHSGSRAISQFLIDNGFFMGDELNITFDKGPFPQIDKLAKDVMTYYKWSFNKLILKKHPVGTERHKHRIIKYFSDICDSKHELKGAKNASITFIYQFLVNYFPNYYYLYWTRSISLKNEHRRGDWGDKQIFGANNVEQAWKSYYDLVKEVPQPKNFLHMRFEDFILDNEKSIEQLENWLDIKLDNRIKLFPERIFPDDHHNLKFEWLKPAMKDLGYI